TARKVRDMPMLAQARGDGAGGFFHGRRLHAISLSVPCCEAQCARRERRRSASRNSRRRLSSSRSALWLAKRLHHKKRNGNRDARVRYIKCRPRIGVANVQIEKEKIDHVPVKKAIGEVPQ